MRSLLLANVCSLRTKAQPRGARFARLIESILPDAASLRPRRLLIGDIFIRSKTSLSHVNLSRPSTPDEGVMGAKAVQLFMETLNRSNLSFLRNSG